jgi:uncharacterized membrane protein
MLALPPVPSWDALHPLIVHFPVALLLVAPLFLLAGLAMKPERGRPAILAGLVLLVLGTAGAWFAIATGEAAGEAAERLPGVNAMLEQHESLAEQTRTVFTGLTVALAAILFGPRLLRRPLARAPQAVILSAFLACYLGGAALLANTAHHGGRLVHELGVRAPMAAGPTLASATAGAAGDQGTADHDADAD